MSAEAAHHDHGHGDGGGGASHGSFGGYVTGFVLSVILTAIPFWLVMNGVIASAGMTAAVILGFAAVQIVVHMVYFLHMNGKIEGGWTMLSTIFTVVFVAIAIAGTLWVMFHMNANMMPDHPQIAPAGQQAPAAGGAHHSAP